MTTHDTSAIDHGGDERLRAHSFDGIQEYDNRLPNWWLWSFYLACIFSVVYWLHYHVLGTGALPHQEYRMEMEAAEAALAAQIEGKEMTDELLEQLASEPTVVAKGKAVFTVHCVSCHTDTGGGNIGPNLTDNYWLHGGKPTDIHRTITKGVITKGMAMWLPVLGPSQCQQVAAYVMSLRGTNVEGGKPPEGDLFER